MESYFSTDIINYSTTESLKLAPSCGRMSILAYSHGYENNLRLEMKEPHAGAQLSENLGPYHDKTCDEGAVAFPQMQFQSAAAGSEGYTKEDLKDIKHSENVSGGGYCNLETPSSEENSHLFVEQCHASPHAHESPYTFPVISCLTNDWAQHLILECAKAISDNSVFKVQYVIRILAELSSPYGDLNQRLAACFLQGLLCKLKGNGAACHNALNVAADRSCSFVSTRQMILKYQEMSPWMTFGHVAANGALMEAFEGETRVHIIDISNTFCTQWPTFLEALATRPEGAPHLRVTTIMATKQSSEIRVMREIENRLKKFARLMGVPFDFKMIQLPKLDKLQIEMLELREDEALAINCIHSLHTVSEKSYGGQLSHRDMLLYMFRRMNPKIVAIVEDEVDLVSYDFMSCICEALRFYFLKFDSLDSSFPRISSERLMLERIAARKLVNVIACDDCENVERQEKAFQWAARLEMLGFSPINLSDDVVYDVTSLMKRYKESSWGQAISGSSLILTWKDQHVISASFWKSYHSLTIRV